MTKPRSPTSAFGRRMPEPTRPECSTTMRSGPRSSCCRTCIGIRNSRSSSRRTTAASSGTSSARPTRARSRTGSTTSGGPSAAPGGRNPTLEQTRQDGTLIYAYSRRGGAEPYGDAYPAHLHIDLLPEVQGQGLGEAPDRDARRGAARPRRGRSCTWPPRPTTPVPSRSTPASDSPRCPRTTASRRSACI